MNRRFVLIPAAAVAMFVLCASDHPTSRPLPTPRVRVRHMTADAIADDPDLEEMARAQEALRRLVVTHPRTEISRDLHQLIEEDRVSLVFHDALTMNRGNFATTMCVPESDPPLVIAVSPTLLLDESESHDFKQMVVYHEYIHIRQELDGRFPCETFIPTMVRDMTEGYMRSLLAAETEAYEAECQFVDEINSDTTLEVCLALERGGRRALREEYARQMIGEPAPGLEWAGELILRVAREP